MARIPSKAEIAALSAFDDDDFDRLLEKGGLFGGAKPKTAPVSLFGGDDAVAAAAPSRTAAATSSSSRNKKGGDDDDFDTPDSPEEKKSSKSKSKKKEKSSSSKKSSSSTSIPPPPPPPPRGGNNSDDSDEDDRRAKKGAPPPPPPPPAATSSGNASFLGELLLKTKGKREELGGIGTDPFLEEKTPTPSTGRSREAPAAPAPAPAAAAAAATTITSSSSSSSKSKSLSTSAVEKRAKKLEKTLDELSQAHNAGGVKEVKSVMSGVFAKIKGKVDSEGLMDGTQVTELLKEIMRTEIHAWAVARAEQEDPFVERMEACYTALDALRSEVDELVQQAAVASTSASKSTLSSSGGGGGGGDDRLEKALKERIAALEAENASLEKKMDKLRSSKRTAKRKVEELEMWQSAVPELRRLLEQTVEEKEHLKAQIQDVETLQSKFKLTWVPDAVATHCLNCDIEFNVFKWKNHCRHCGRVFCFDCTARKVEIPSLGFNYDVNVCDHCYNLLRRPTR